MFPNPSLARLRPVSSRVSPQQVSMFSNPSFARPRPASSPPISTRSIVFSVSPAVSANLPPPTPSGNLHFPDPNTLNNIDNVVTTTTARAVTSQSQTMSVRESRFEELQVRIYSKLQDNLRPMFFDKLC